MSEDGIERHIIAVLVDNEAGVLARVVGLFSGRGYNIECLNVAEIDPEAGQSRITVVTSGTPQIIEQIKAQLTRLVPVHKVSDLTQEGPHVGRELALIKVRGRGEKRVESLRIADIRIDPLENCFPMIPSGAAHCDMLLGPADRADTPISEEGMVLV